MGMYDSVMVPCPQCGARSEFQTKSGDCLLDTFKMESAPLHVLLDVNRHAPNTCKVCGTVFAVKVRAVAESVVWTPSMDIDEVKP